MIMMCCPNGSAALIVRIDTLFARRRDRVTRHVSQRHDDGVDDGLQNFRSQPDTFESRYRYPSFRISVRRTASIPFPCSQLVARKDSLI